MTKQEFLSELERALGKLPHAEVEQALAFYDEAISDRMEDGLSEAEAVAGLGPVDEIAAQIAAETPPIPRAIARANTGSRSLNIVLLAVFSPIWVTRRARARGGRARRVRRDLGGHRRAVGRGCRLGAHALRGAGVAHGAHRRRQTRRPAPSSSASRSS